VVDLKLEQVAGFDFKWWIIDVVAGADEHRFVTLWQTYSQKQAVLVAVIHQPSKSDCPTF
jgi:hypothetical protein